MYSTFNRKVVADNGRPHDSCVLENNYEYDEKQVQCHLCALYKIWKQRPIDFIILKHSFIYSIDRHSIVFRNAARIDALQVKYG